MSVSRLLRTVSLGVTAVLLLLVTLTAAAKAVVVQNPANGHYYEVVAGANTWYEANTAAAASSYAGCPGHLVTITDEAENDFVSNITPLEGGWLWMGGQKSGNGWVWITGEATSYLNWKPGEPSGDGTCMDFCTFDIHGKWNDERCSGSAGVDPALTGGYIVEYDAPCPTAAVPTSWGHLKCIYR